MCISNRMTMHMHTVIEVLEFQFSQFVALPGKYTVNGDRHLMHTFVTHHTTWLNRSPFSVYLTDFSLHRFK